MSRADPLDGPPRSSARRSRRLKTVHVDGARAEDRARALERENVELKRLVESLRRRPAGDDAASSRARGCALLKTRSRIRSRRVGVHRSESSESLATSAREKRLAGFRTKSHKFVVRECDEQGEGFAGRRGATATATTIAMDWTTASSRRAGEGGRARSR